MRELFQGDSQMLGGAITGRKALAILVERTGQNPSEPEEIYLDFDGVEVATASFLREAVLAFRDTIRRDRPNYYPVVANANDLIVDELKVLLGARGDALMLCTLDHDAKASNPRLTGDLEPKQKATFELVQQGETDAAQLMKEHGEAEGVKQTAFNNRLAALAVLGLVKEVMDGRVKRYRPLLSGS